MTTAASTMTTTSYESSLPLETTPSSQGQRKPSEVINPSYITPPSKEKLSQDSRPLQQSSTLPFPVTRIPSVSSVSGDSVDTSKDSKRHLEVWNRFFENALLVNQAREDSDAGSKFRIEKGGVSVGGFTPSFVRKKQTLFGGKDEWNLPPTATEYEELVSTAFTLKSNQMKQRDRHRDDSGKGPNRETIVSPVGNEQEVIEAGNWALLGAVMRGDLQTTEDLLLHGFNPSLCLDDHQRTPLHHACHSGDIRMISLLNDYGGDVDSLDSQGQSPLHIACEYHHTEAAQCLLQCGATPDLQDHHGNTSLHVVAYNGNIDCCQILLEYGARVDLQNSNEQTPLDLAHLALTTSQDSRPSLGVRKVIASLTAAQPDINHTLFEDHRDDSHDQLHHRHHLGMKVTSDQILINSNIDEEYSLPSESVSAIEEEDYYETVHKQVKYTQDPPRYYRPTSSSFPTPSPSPTPTPLHPIPTPPLPTRPMRSDSISSLSVNSDDTSQSQDHHSQRRLKKNLRNPRKKFETNPSHTTVETKRNEWIQRGRESSQHTAPLGGGLGIALPNSTSSKMGPSHQQQQQQQSRSSLLDQSHPASALTVETDPPSVYDNSLYGYYDQPVLVPALTPEVTHHSYPPQARQTPTQSREEDEISKKIPPLTGSKVVSNVVWGAVSLLDATWKMFSISPNDSSPEETSPSEKESNGSWSNNVSPPLPPPLVPLPSLSYPLLPVPFSCTGTAN
jgi:hypothetical protein